MSKKTMTQEREQEIRRTFSGAASSGALVLYECLDAIAAQRKRIERLEAALKPFAEYWNTYGYGPEKGMDAPFEAAAEALEVPNV